MKIINELYRKILELLKPNEPDAVNFITNSSLKELFKNDKAAFVEALKTGISNEFHVAIINMAPSQTEVKEYLSRLIDTQFIPYQKLDSTIAWDKLSCPTVDHLINGTKSAEILELNRVKELAAQKIIENIFYVAKNQYTNWYTSTTVVDFVFYYLSAVVSGEYKAITLYLPVEDAMNIYYMTNSPKVNLCTLQIQLGINQSTREFEQLVNTSILNPYLFEDAKEANFVYAIRELHDGSLDVICCFNLEDAIMEVIQS